ncbi:MAG: AAA family ATPase [Promethearchaeia archaeon]
MIKKINIQKFRGFVDSEIILDGRNLIIKGDNGTGKSTIVDALEYFFTNKIKHLTKGEKLSVKEYAPHVKYSPEDLKIDIEFKNGKKSTKTIKDKPIIPPRMEELFNTAREQKFILNRSELLEFINSSPSDRFKIIAKLIGLGDLEKQSKEFSKLSNEISKHLNLVEDSYNKILEKISKFLKTKATNTSDILEKLNSKLSKLSFPELKSIDDIEKYKEAHFKNVLLKTDYSKTFKDLENILTLSNSISINPKIYDLIIEFKILNIKLREIQHPIDLELYKFLESGLKLLKLRNPKQCPLCKQSINIYELISDLNNRLMKRKEYLEKLKELEKLKNNFKDLMEPLINNLTNLITNINQINELENKKEKFLSLKISVEKIMEIIPKNDKDYESIEMSLKKNEKELNKFLKELNLECNNMKKKLELTEKDKESYEVLNLLNNIQLEYENLKSKKIELLRIKRKYEIANLINNIFSEVLKEEINKIFESLDSEINRLYLFLHPNDLHENIKLEIDPNRRGSLFLKMDSFNCKSRDPRVLASEGHLDSLGICIFLSFVKKFNKTIPFIVLDDIITTIDANHREKLAKLLLTEFPEHQLIITTHDGLWFKQLIENLKALKLEHKWEILSIIDWDLSHGPEFSDYKDLWEKIQDYYKRGDSDVAGILTRRYLEWVLKKICLALKAEIEYKSDPKYTVKELFDSAYKRVNKLCKRIVDNEDFKNNLKEKFENLKSWTYLGNLLAHENPEIELISTNEIKNFSNLVHELFLCITCSECGNLLKYNREFSEIRCSKKKCKNLPVKLK